MAVAVNCFEVDPMSTTDELVIGVRGSRFDAPNASAQRTFPSLPTARVQPGFSAVTFANNAFDLAMASSSVGFAFGAEVVVAAGLAVVGAAVVGPTVAAVVVAADTFVVVAAAAFVVVVLLAVDVEPHAARQRAPRHSSAEVEVSRFMQLTVKTQQRERIHRWSLPHPSKG
jgi:hypothetical protein